jgi:hypothetical protein
MTSYQARLKEIRELKMEIEILTGDNFCEVEAIKARYRMRRAQEKQAMFGTRQSEPPFKTGGLWDQMTHAAEEPEEKPLFPRARKWFIIVAILGAIALLAGYWLKVPDVTVVGIICILAVITVASSFIVYDETITKTKHLT